MKVAIIDFPGVYRDVLCSVVKDKFKHDNFLSLDLTTDEEKIHDLLKLLKENKPNLIFINAGLATSQEGIEFLKHIRLTTWLNDSLRKIPILVYSLNSQQCLLRQKPNNAILLSKGCNFIDMLGLNKVIASEGLVMDDENNCFTIVDPWIPLQPLDAWKSIESFVDVDSKDVILSDRHSIANWWGPIRLLRGYSLYHKKDWNELANNHPVIKKFEEEKKKLSVKKLLFFKRENIDAKCSDKKIPKEELNIILKGKKVLYIDDEANLGWNDAFATILFGAKERYSKKGATVYKKNSEDCLIVFDIFNLPFDTKPENLDIILLDLRDKNDDSKTDPGSLSGVSLLRKIKDEEDGDPSVPVIIVTASNKQWNYEKVLGLGANGYWIKESPAEYGISDEFSHNNYERFYDLVKRSSEISYLRRIWQDIRVVAQILRSGQRQQGQTIIGLMKQAFYSMQYWVDPISKATPQDGYKLNDLLTLLRLAWEAYHGTYNINRSKVVVIPSWFICRICGNFIHNTYASELKINDLVNIFRWLKWLLVQDDWPLLQFCDEYGSNKGKCFYQRNGDRYWQVGHREHPCSTYATYWNFVKVSGIIEKTEFKEDCEAIRKRALELAQNTQVEFDTENQFFVERNKANVVGNIKNW